MNPIENLNNVSNEILKLIPEIVYIGNPILRTPTRSVDLEEGIIIGKKLIEILKKYRELTGIGRGLAAPQIGINSSVVVTFVDEVFTIYLNPKIISQSEKKNVYKENCLSSCHMWCDVIRSEIVVVQYINEAGETKTGEYSGFLARLMQHEIDHLSGIVNVDKAVMGTIDYKTGDPLKEVLRDI